MSGTASRSSRTRSPSRKSRDRSSSPPRRNTKRQAHKDTVTVRELVQKFQVDVKAFKQHAVKSRQLTAELEKARGAQDAKALERHLSFLRKRYNGKVNVMSRIYAYAYALKTMTKPTLCECAGRATCALCKWSPDKYDALNDGEDVIANAEGSDLFTDPGSNFGLDFFRRQAAEYSVLIGRPELAAAELYDLYEQTV